MLNHQELCERIQYWKQQRQALILAHNYELGEVQDIADFAGDSLELSMIAAKNDAAMIVFCGVHFMAETAAILAPEKTVLLPVKAAGCRMADLCPVEELRKLKAQHPGAEVVCYVNSSAEVKAESTLCVTSANAFGLVKNLPADREIIFVPDRNLGANIMRTTGRNMILWDGCCPIHDRITAAMIAAKRAEFPDAQLIVHPEAAPEIVALADKVLSTGGMCHYVKTTKAKQVIVATEIGLIHRLRKENLLVQYIPLSEQLICSDMKLIQLTDVLAALEREQYRITVPEAIRVKAEIPIRRMLDESERLTAIR